MVYYCNDYEICTDTHEIRHKGDLQKIEPLIFNLLIFMLENPNRVLSRDELMQQVWNSRIVSDSAISATISILRHVMGDSGREQKIIKTVSGQGYRFVANFTTTNRVSLTEAHSTPPPANIDKKERLELMPLLPLSNLVTVSDNSQPPQQRELVDKPSVAIMDFDHLDLGTNQNGTLLAKGLTAEINSSLSRLPHFFVIARASSACLSQLNLSAREVGLRLGVRYLVYGQTNYFSKRIRVTISLVDAVQDAEIWSEHYDRSIDDLFLLQNDISATLIHAIDAAIEQAEIERAFLIPTENLSAWENYHRGLSYMNQTTSQGVDRAQHYFKAALQHDSRFARANAGMGYTHVSRKLLNDTPSQKKEMQNAFKYGYRSIDSGQREAMGYMSLGRTLYFSNQYEKSIQTIEQGLQINPNYVHCLYFKGLGAISLGQNVFAQKYFDLINRLSPFDPLRFSMKMMRAISLAQQRKYNEAASWSVQATQCSNAYFTTYAIAVACLQLAGFLEQAKQYADKVLTLKPEYSTELYKALSPHGNESTRIAFIQALQDAGIPEKSPASAVF